MVQQLDLTFLRSEEVLENIFQSHWFFSFLCKRCSIPCLRQCELLREHTFLKFNLGKLVLTPETSIKIKT